MSIVKSCSEVWNRLFDHKSFLQSELNTFVKDFEINRHDREVESLLDCLNVQCEVKNECNKVISSDLAVLEQLRNKVEHSLQLANYILSDTKPDKFVIENRRQEREEDWRKFKQDMDVRYSDVDIKCSQQLDGIEKNYEVKERCLKNFSSTHK